MSNYQNEALRERLQMMYEIRWRKRSIERHGKDSARAERHRGRIDFLWRQLEANRMFTEVN